jgi:hypothetical protein
VLGTGGVARGLLTLLMSHRYNSTLTQANCPEKFRG